MSLTPAFTKLQRSIVTSSIWLQDMETRLVWITLLALCDRDGIVRASPNGLAHQARVSTEACHKALELLQAPDADSRSHEHEGRRIERVDGGFLLLNYTRILQEGAREERREYNRGKQAEGRAKRRANGGTIRPEHVAKPKKIRSAYEELMKHPDHPGTYPIPNGSPRLDPNRQAPTEIPE